MVLVYTHNLIIAHDIMRTTTAATKKVPYSNIYNGTNRHTDLIFKP